MVATRQPTTTRHRPAVVLPGVCISAVLLTTALTWPQVRQSGVGADNDRPVTVAAVQGNVPRLGSTSTPSAAPCSTTTSRETIRLADDVRAGRAPQPTLSSGRRTPRTSTRSANPDAAGQISVAAAEAIDAPILVGGVLPAPATAATTRCPPTP